MVSRPPKRTLVYEGTHQPTIEDVEATAEEVFKSRLDLQTERVAPGFVEARSGPRFSEYLKRGWEDISFDFVVSRSERNNTMWIVLTMTLFVNPQNTSNPSDWHQPGDGDRLRYFDDVRVVLIRALTKQCGGSRAIFLGEKYIVVLVRFERRVEVDKINGLVFYVAPENVQIVAVEKLIHGRESIDTHSVIQELVVKTYPREILWLTVCWAAKAVRLAAGENSTLPANRDGLQFEVPATQQRCGSNKLPRRKILGREVALINRVEFVEEAQVRARNLHVHQVVHRHSGLR